LEEYTELHRGESKAAGRRQKGKGVDTPPSIAMAKSAEVQEKKRDRESPLRAKSAEVIGSKGDKASGAGKGRDELAAVNHIRYYHRMTKKSSKNCRNPAKFVSD
jgi:hypothetical protein